MSWFRRSPARVPLEQQRAALTEKKDTARQALAMFQTDGWRVVRTYLQSWHEQQERVIHDLTTPAEARQMACAVSNTVQTILSLATDYAKAVKDAERKLDQLEHPSKPTTDEDEGKLLTLAS